MCKSLCIVLHMHACSVAQSYLTLCHPMDCSLPGISVHAISQEGILEWVACPPGDLPSPGIKPTSPTLQADFFFFFFLKPLCYQGSSTELYRDRLSGTSWLHRTHSLSGWHQGNSWREKPNLWLECLTTCQYLRNLSFCTNRNVCVHQFSYILVTNFYSTTLRTQNNFFLGKLTVA